MFYLRYTSLGKKNIYYLTVWQSLVQLHLNECYFCSKYIICPLSILSLNDFEELLLACMILNRISFLACSVDLG